MVARFGKEYKSWTAKVEGEIRQSLFVLIFSSQMGDQSDAKTVTDKEAVVTFCGFCGLDVQNFSVFTHDCRGLPLVFIHYDLRGLSSKEHESLVVNA